jgi:hypothetical protein
MLLSGCFLFSAFKTPADDAGGIITVEVQQWIPMTKHYIKIAYADGTSETMDIDIDKHDISKNVVLINNVLNKIRAKGYRLAGITTQLGDGIVDYVFEKD